MATVRIDLPDQQAAVLTARATAQGLSLEDWFKRLAEQEARAGQRSASKGRYNLAELMQQCDAGAARSVEDSEWLDDSSTGREAL
jgi:hypothetical protein